MAANGWTGLEAALIVGLAAGGNMPDGAWKAVTRRCNPDDVKQIAAIAARNNCTLEYDDCHAEYSYFTFRPMKGE